jgi:2'-5' RNA ligase
LRTPRTFVAIFPPPGVQEALLRAARGLLAEDSVRWTRPANVHLTLKFLGETPEENLEDIHAALGAVAGRHGAFRVRPSGLGAFPSARRGRTIWAGVDEGSDSLQALAEDVEKALEPLGFGRERRAYTPHATLGRVRKRFVRLPEPDVGRLPDFRARRLDLVESVPGPDGVSYTVRGSYPLSGAPAGGSR